ncbi:MAG: PQQ-dependent sugar dehydrogenase [Planctomycetota bacterium]
MKTCGLCFVVVLTSVTSIFAQTDPTISPDNQTVRMVEFASGLGGFDDGSGQLNQYVPTDLVQLNNGRWVAMTLGGPIRLLDDQGTFLDSQQAPYVQLPTAVGGFGNELNYGSTTVEPHPDFLNPGMQGYGKLFTVVTRPRVDGLPFDFGFGNSHYDRLVEYSTDNPLAANPSWTTRDVLTIRQPGPIHNLFDLDFGPDGYLYGSVGDGGGDPSTSQDETTIFGNVFRINPFDPGGAAPGGEKLSANGSYSIPLDNPLVGQAGVIEEAWSYGLRSPFTLNFSNNGELYVGDVGEGEREEVNRITRNSNQGWSRFEGTGLFDPGVQPVPGTTHNVPRFEYDHDDGRAVVAGFVYDGDYFPELRGKFIFGDFQGQTEEEAPPFARLFYGDLSTGEIFEFNYDALGLTFDEIAILNIGQGIDGEIYLATSVASTAQQAPADPAGGAIFRLIRASLTDLNDDGVSDITDLNLLLAEGPVQAGVAVVPGVNERFDLTGDGVINDADLSSWLESAAAENGFATSYKVGDANLDGTVDGQDFVLWNGSKFTSTLEWNGGDFNGDGVADGQDFVLWNSNKFTTSDTPVVPEPRGVIVLVGSFCLLAARRASRLA